MFDIDKKYNDLNDSGTRIFGFVGDVSKMNVEEMIAFAERKLTDNLRLKKRLINILVETAQNLKFYHCSACDNTENREIFIIAQKRTDKLLFQAGNYILKSDMDGIESRIKMVNAIPKENLGDLYRGVLDYGSVSNSGGAGLGFIDIARKSDSPLTYTLDKIDDKTYFFTLEISINI
ncbi:MAG: SiaB family protein kinase [Bacteroidota bacterium]